MPQRIGPSDLHAAKDRGHFALGTLTTGTKSVYVDCNDIDRLSAQVTWDNTLTGTVKVFCSNSYIPDPRDPQNSGTNAPLRAGTFTDITSRVTKGTDPAGGPGNMDIDCAFVSQCYLRIDITQSAGSANNVDVYLSGKTIGR